MPAASPLILRYFRLHAAYHYCHTIVIIHFIIIFATIAASDAPSHFISRFASVITMPTRCVSAIFILRIITPFRHTMPLSLLRFALRHHENMRDATPHHIIFIDTVIFRLTLLLIISPTMPAFDIAIIFEYAAIVSPCHIAIFIRHVI